MKQKMAYPCRVLLIKSISKELKIRVTSGSVFDSLLSLTAESQFFGNLSTNNSIKIRQISKSLLGMSTETRIIRLVKKGSQKISLHRPFKPIADTKIKN
jgi:hypothetical protein